MYSALKKEMLNEGPIRGKGANLAEMTRLGLPVPSGLLLLPRHVNYSMRQVKSYPRL